MPWIKQDFMNLPGKLMIVSMRKCVSLFNSGYLEHISLSHSSSRIPRNLAFPLISEEGTLFEAPQREIGTNLPKTDGGVGVLIFIPMEKGNFTAMSAGSLVKGHIHTYLYGKNKAWKWNRAQSPGLGGKAGPGSPSCMSVLTSSCAGQGCKWLIISLKPGLSSKPDWHKMTY